MVLNEKRVHQHLRTFERLLQDYMAGQPLARFLTAFYKRNKQMGSSDRRMASRLLYHYFRLGNAAADAAPTERLAMAEFLCSNESAVVQLLKPEWHPHITAALPGKKAFLETHSSFRSADVFPYAAQLSADVDQQAFVDSLFTQPDLFIRLRTPHQTAVTAALSRAGIAYEQRDGDTVALPNGTALDRVPAIAGKYEVQDASSQETGRYFKAMPGESWWDACAGAGGKSLLLMDYYPAVNLLVSDVRGSILRNLDERFDAAGIRSYRRKIIDLTKDAGALLGGEQFDGIILDVPCSGSGTWARTPEMIPAFDNGQIGAFAELQRRIAGNAIKHLKPGKPLIYITCSVFAEENEGSVAFLAGQHDMEVVEQALLKGYHGRADTLFVARMVRR